MVNVAICDDSPVECKYLYTLIQKYYFQKNKRVKIDIFHSGKELLDYSNTPAFDVVFLDIIMEGINGIETATRLRKFDNLCRIIFLTFTSEYAVESYEVNAFHYLLKPLQEKILYLVLDKVMAQIQNKEENVIALKQKNSLFIVRYQDILYIESSNHQLLFHTLNNGSISIYKKMDELPESLINDGRFIRTHKSYLINATYVKAAKASTFVLTNSAEIPVSRTYSEEAKKQYYDFLFQNISRNYL